MSRPTVITGSDGSSCLSLHPIRGDSDVIFDGGVYKYRVELRPELVLERLEPFECFEIDPDSVLTGRFLPANHVGTIRVVASCAGGVEVAFDVEVRPAKLEYETEYRWLLEQVADRAAEAVLQGFAPSLRRVSASSGQTGELPYRSLAFVAARLRDPGFQAAIARVLRSPHRRWHEVSESRPLAAGLRSGSMVARELVRPGRRSSPTPDSLRHLPLTALPQQVRSTRNEVTFDTGPNRFVRFVFQHWQSLAMNLRRQLEERSTGSDPQHRSGPQRRGLAEAAWIEERCDEVLRSPALAEVGPMRVFPHGDPVLLRQPGYREILRVFALAEASMSLDVHVDDDVFSATQRNLATLYEYWTFLVLVDCLSDLCGAAPEGVIFAPSPAGLSLVLREGSASNLTWVHERADRRLSLDLWFNQTFREQESSDAEVASWASSIRPDASLRIRPLSGRPGAAPDPHLDAWIHFDAKFRLDVRPSQITDADPWSTAKRTDLLKMHAYRDLIRRSAGAYVLYPGSGEPQRHREFHEVLPGIGAFPLRPGPNGTVEGSPALREFLDETLELTANQASVNERRRFWEFEHHRTDARSVRAVGFLSAPPADTPVLIGHLAADYWPWVRTHRRYALRADDRDGAVRSSDAVLAAELALLWSDDGTGAVVMGLYERTGPWQVVSGDTLRNEGFPDGDASVYLVSPVNPVTAIVEALVRPAEELDLPDDLTPVCSSWAEVARGPA